MRQNTEKNQDTLYQNRLRRSKLILEDMKSGVWEQIHKTVLPKSNQQNFTQGGLLMKHEMSDEELLKAIETFKQLQPTGILEQRFGLEFSEKIATSQSEVQKK